MNTRDFYAALNAAEKAAAMAKEAIAFARKKSDDVTLPPMNNVTVK